MKSRKVSIVSMIVLILAAIIVLFPLIWVLTTSLKNTPELLENIWGIPTKFHWENYVKAWQKTRFAENLGNSLIVTFASLALSVVCSATTAYIIARYTFRFHKQLKGLYMVAMMVPSIISLIPQYFLLNTLHLLDNRLGLILCYGLGDIPFNIFILLGFFATIPHELEDAALIDGASDLQAFTRIMFPLAQPGLVTVAVVGFIGYWNEYYKARVYMATPSKLTIPVSLVNFETQCQATLSWGPMMASCMLMIVPTVLVYCIFRKSIQAGLTAGAVKG